MGKGRGGEGRGGEGRGEEGRGGEGRGGEDCCEEALHVCAQSNGCGHRRPFPQHLEQCLTVSLSCPLSTGAYTAVPTSSMLQQRHTII